MQVAGDADDRRLVAVLLRERDLLRPERARVNHHREEVAARETGQPDLDVPAQPFAPEDVRRNAERLQERAQSGGDV